MKILIVDANRNFLKQGCEALEKEGVEILTARTSREADEKMAKWDGTKMVPMVNGVITDFYLPLTDSGYWNHNECPVGLRVAANAKEIGIPVIFCTAGYHHGSKYEWLRGFLESVGLPRMIDTGRDYHREADNKDWEGALKALLGKKE